MPKNKKNAFSFFLESYCIEEKTKGRNISKRTAAEECGPLWTNLPDEGKNIFRIMAKRAKESEREGMESGPSCSKVWENQAVKALIEEKAAIRYLEAAVKDENDTRNRLFYTIHVNYYCMVNEKKYLPGELALCEFNLQDGVVRKFNVMINPGKIPVGFAYEVKRFITEVHGLPQPEEEAQSDLTQISRQILEFMEPTKDEKNNFPPLFTTRLNIQASTNVINELVTPSGSQPKFKVYEADILLYWLNKKSATYGIDEGYSSKSLATYEINKDLFQYYNEICCVFHKNAEDNYYGCSLSHAQRIAFSICQPCCRLLSIPLVQGDHMPGRSPDVGPIRVVPLLEYPGVGCAIGENAGPGGDRREEGGNGGNAEPPRDDPEA